jgi:hypothetical protein
MIKFWIAPVGEIGKLPSHERAREIVGKHRIFAITEANYIRTSPRKGDRICFYASGVGVVADAEIAGDPEKRSDDRIPNSAKYSFVFPLDRVRLYIEQPVALNHHVRAQLKGLGHDENTSWAWFVHNFHGVCDADFRILTRRPARDSTAAPSKT